MKNLDKILCLHCYEDKERYNYITDVLNKVDLLDITYISEFTKLDINLEIGKSLDRLHEPYYDYCEKEIKPTIYANVFSCMYNWLQLVSLAYYKYDNIVCIEDDIKFDCDKKTFIECIEKIPEDADIVLLGYIFSNGYKINGFDEWIRIKNTELFTKLNSNYKLTGMYAVWMNKRGMDYYLKYIQTNCHPSDLLFSDIDNELQKEMNINIYVCNKATINHNYRLQSKINKE